MSIGTFPPALRELRTAGKWAITVAAAAALGLTGVTAASAAAKAPVTAAESHAQQSTKKNTTTRARPNETVSLPEQPNLAGHFVSTAPTRLLDTRIGLGAPKGPVGRDAVTLDVSSVTGDPSVTPVAVVFNVTVTGATTGGNLAVMSGGYTQTPTTSNLNFSAGQTVANQVTIPVGTDGRVSFHNAAGTVQVIADLAGYYTPDTAGASYVADGPLRLLDTRKGTGTGGVIAAVGAGKSIKLQIAGEHGLPATGISAATLNLTETDAAGGGYITAYPDKQSVPNASSLNFTKGQTVANLVTVKVGTDGAVDFQNASTGTVDLVADLAGYFLSAAPTSGGILQTTGPARLLDTRNGTGAAKAKVGPNGHISLQIGGVGGIPATSVSAVILNVTVTNPTAGGFITAYPDKESLPNASNINYGIGQTVPNLVVVPVGSDGVVDLANSSTGSTDLIADVFGYYSTAQDLKLSALSFATSSVDASAGGASDTVTWTIADSNATNTGLVGEIVFREIGTTPNSYLGQPYIEDFQYGQSLYVSGTATNSTYSYQFAVPTYAAGTSAKWGITMLAASDSTDEQLVLAGSELSGYSSTLTATELASTTTPALDNTGVTLLSNVASAPDYLYDGVDNAVEYRLSPYDANSGFWRGTLQLSGPGGATLSSNFSILWDGSQAAGDCQNFGNRIWATDATCTVTIEFPAGAAAGTWVASAVTLTNNAGQSKAYTGLNEAPLTVTADRVVTASGFAPSATTVNNWNGNAPFTVSMNVVSAQGGVKSIQLVWMNMGGLCTQQSTTPTLVSGSRYSVPVSMFQASNGRSTCTLNDVIVTDGNGNVALYGPDFSAPTVNVVVQTIPDTTPPTASAATLTMPTVAQSQIGNYSYDIQAQVSDKTAPISGSSSYLYNSAGQVVGQAGGGQSVSSSGQALISLYVPYGLAVGTYTVGFSITDAGGLTTSYGAPGGSPMPGGTLTFTVTAG